MQKICFHFQISQPFRLRTYRFFDINQHHDYFDDFQNSYLVNRLAERCYLPANHLMLDLIRRHPGKIAVSYSIAGSSLKLFQEYCPEVIESFRELLATGQVEITGSTFTHSVASLHGKSTFVEQVRLQEELLKEVFGIQPTSFCNTEMIYSDEIGEWLCDLGYKTVLTEGAKHILAWKQPGYLYCNPFQTDLRLLLRNYALCDDITLRFQDKGWDQYPLTAEKYLGFLKAVPAEVPRINLAFDYETIGEYYTKETGIFDFFRSLFEHFAQDEEYQMVTPNSVADSDEKCTTLNIPWPISGSGEEKDTVEWLGNDLQQEAFDQLFKLENLYLESRNEAAKLNWLRLQAADHFNFMSTKWLGKMSVRRNFDVYPSPYQAFINFMNVLADVKLQLGK